MTQNARKEDLCQYLEFGCLDRLDNAYCDSTQCFSLYDAAILYTSKWLIFDIVIDEKDIEVLIVIKMMEMRFEYAFI